MTMSPTFSPSSLDFGSDLTGSTGPAYDPDVFASPPPFPPGTVWFWGGSDSPAGNITASITGDTTHFKIINVTAYKPFVVHGLHYRPVGSSDGIAPLAVSTGQAVAVQIQYNLENATGTLHAILQIHGDTPAWAPDTQIPLTVSVIPIRKIGTAFGKAGVTISQGGVGDLPITVTNVTGPATDVTYSLPAAWAPSTSIGGVAIASGLTMEEYTFRQIPAGATQSGTLHFALPPSGVPAGSYPFSIAMWAFDGTPPNNNNPVSPTLILNANPVQISVSVVPNGHLTQVDGVLITQVLVRIALGSNRGLATVAFSPGVLPQGVSMPAPPTFTLSANDYPSIPSWPPTNVDAAGSIIGHIGLTIDPRALLQDNPTVTINWSAYNAQQTGSFSVVIEVQAERSLPLPPVGLQPQNGASGVPTEPYLFFRDPGAGTPAAADQFEFIVSQNNIIVDPSHTLTGYVSISSPLTPNGVKWGYPLPLGQVSLEVWGKNRAGTGPGSVSTFMVGSPPPPPPPPPQITARQQDQNSKAPQNIVISGKGFEPSRSVTVLVEVQNSISNQQDLRHGSFPLQSTPAGTISFDFNPIDYFGGQPTPYPGRIDHGELVFVTAANTDAGSLQIGQPGVSNQVQFNWR
jgi:hypothetical protein